MQAYAISPVLLVCLAIAVIGGVAALAYHAGQGSEPVSVATVSPTAIPAKTAASSSVSTTATSPPHATVTPAVNATPSAAPFLDVKELGIKLPLSAQILDLTYAYIPPTDGSSPAALELSTLKAKKIPTWNGKNTCGTALNPFGSYTVYTSRQSNEGGGDAQAGTLEATVNGKYIYYHHGQSACGDNVQESNELISLIDPVLTAVKNAQAD